MPSEEEAAWRQAERRGQGEQGFGRVVMDMKCWTAFVMAVMISSPALGGDCQVVRVEITPELGSIDRSDLGLIALGDTNAVIALPKAQRVENLAAAERAMAWTFRAHEVLDFAEAAGCADAVGAIGIRAAV
jgi:hypothetical protein